MFSKKFFLFIITLIPFFVFPSYAKAVDIVISNYPASISDNEFSIDVSVSGASNATNYLRVDLYKDGTNNYFGETYTGSTWYGGSSGTNYFPIVIQNATASATVLARIGSPNSNDYSGPGSYKLRIRRYTSSGNSASDQQNPVDINIAYLTPSPSPSPSPTSQATSNPTPTSTSTPVKTFTPKPSPTKTSSPRPTSTPGEEPHIDQEHLLREKSEFATPSPTPVGQVKGAKKINPTHIFSITLIILGVGLLLYVGINLYKKAKLEYNNSHEMEEGN